MITEKIEGAHYSIKLNRPDMRNAFNPEMIQKLTQAFRTIHANKKIRAVPKLEKMASYYALAIFSRNDVNVSAFLAALQQNRF